MNYSSSLPPQFKLVSDFRSSAVTPELKPSSGTLKQDRQKAIAFIFLLENLQEILRPWGAEIYPWPSKDIL